MKDNKKQVMVHFWPKMHSEADYNEMFMAGYNARFVLFCDMEEFEIDRKAWRFVEYEITDDENSNPQEQTTNLASGRYRLNGDRLERFCKRGGWREYEEFMREEEDLDARDCDHEVCVEPYELTLDEEEAEKEWADYENEEEWDGEGNDEFDGEEGNFV